MSVYVCATEKDGKKDSYLRRYYRTLPEEKRLTIEKSLMNANSGQAHISGRQKGHVGAPTDPDKEGIENKDGTDAEDSEASNAKEPKKSSTCIVL